MTDTTAETSAVPMPRRPAYVSVAEASKQWKDDAVVDAFTIDGRARAYPRFITVWHEIVNESVGGKPISITYCPLTGSTLVFSGQLADGSATTFGTSGMLYNSNLVMYDRATKSMWPQLLGVAVRGDRRGERLAEIGGAVTTTVGRWKAKFPDGLVLSKDTGHARAYGTWPYGDPLPSLVVSPHSARSLTSWLDPLFVLYVSDAVVLAPSFPAILTVLVLGALVGANGAMAVEAFVRRPPACATGGGPWWIAAALPSFLASFSCCAPTVLLLLGAGAAGAVISVIPFVVPAAAALLLASLAWSAHRLERTTILVAA